MVLHLAWWLVTSLYTIDGLAGGALQAAIFVSVVVHSHQALQVVLVSALRQTANGLSSRNTTHARTFIARGSCQSLHTDSAVLLWRVANLLQVPPHDFLRSSAFPGLFLCSLAAAVTQAWHWLDVTLADRWGVKHQFRGTSQTNRKSSSAHQNARNSSQGWVNRAGPI